MKTTNYQKALAIHRKEERDGIKQLTTSLGIKDACDRYMQDAQARDLKEPTLYKFRLLFRQLQAFADDKGLVFMSDLNVDNLRQFRATWPNENESARVKLGNFRAFIGFCHKSKWIEENYAEDLKAGKVVDRKIVPLEHDEIVKILKACDTHSQKTRGILLKAMILVILYTGLRIRDVVTLRRDSMRGNRLFLRTAKTGVDVFCPFRLGLSQPLELCRPRTGGISGMAPPNRRARSATTRNPWPRSSKPLVFPGPTPPISAHLCDQSPARRKPADCLHTSRALLHQDDRAQILALD